MDAATAQRARLLDEIEDELQALWKYLANFHEEVDFTFAYRRNGHEDLALWRSEHGASDLHDIWRTLRTVGMRGLVSLENYFSVCREGLSEMLKAESVASSVSYGLLVNGRHYVSLALDKLPTGTVDRNNPFPVDQDAFRQIWFRVCDEIGYKTGGRMHYQRLFEKAKSEVHSVRMWLGIPIPILPPPIYGANPERSSDDLTNQLLGPRPHLAVFTADRGRHSARNDGARDDGPDGPIVNPSGFSWRGQVVELNLTQLAFIKAIWDARDCTIDTIELAVAVYDDEEKAHKLGNLRYQVNHIFQKAKPAIPLEISVHKEKSWITFPPGTELAPRAKKALTRLSAE